VTTVVTFNVRQTNTLEHQKADLVSRMKDADVLLLQETVHLDLHAFAADNPGWAAFQVRNGDNDGHANTGVLYRTTLGTSPATDIAFLGDANDTRPRFLAAVQLGPWFGSAHIFPERDQPDISEQLHHLGAWVKAHPGPVVIGLDKNQCRPAASNTPPASSGMASASTGSSPTCPSRTPPCSPRASPTIKGLPPS
jgi:hypothetical protein